MKKIFSLLINKVTLGFLGIVLLIAIVWVGGSLLEIDAKYRVFALVFILVQFAVVIILKTVSAKKQSAELESYLKSQAEEEALGMGLDHEDKMDSLKTQLNESINAIKKSKLSKKWWGGGSSALYELPWYIIVGPPSSGKSTLLQNSSLSFPQVSSEGKGIQGVGGTRNCDWWFSNEAIFLDTAGRYTTEEEDKEEWLGFLDLLKKHRKKKPINGAIVGFSVTDLLEMSDDQLDAAAQNIRDRLDELIQRLKVKYPVYISFTKCDRIQGFVDIFSDLTTKEREQVWGCTFSSAEFKKEEPLSIFQAEIKRLQKTLDSWRMHVLDKVPNQRIRDRAFLFPLQFDALESKMLRFLRTLIQPNPYQDFPMFRGFYFTCGTQEGSPIDQVIDRIGSAMNLPPDIVESFEDIGEKKSYFIKDFFTNIVIPDQEIAHISQKTWALRSLVKLSGILSAAVVSVVLIVFFYSSYTGNKELLTQLRYHLVEVDAIEWDNQTQLMENLNSLNALKTDLKWLVDYEESGVPLRLGLGLYRGNVVNGPAREVYFKKLTPFFIQPLKQQIELEIRTLTRKHPEPGSDAWKSLYDRLKLYVMLNQHDKVENTFLESELPIVWESYLESAPVKDKHRNAFFKSGMEQLNFYMDQIYKGDAPTIENDEMVVKLARSVLNDVSVNMRLYSNLVNDAKEIEPFTLRRKLSDNARIIMKTDHKIQGAFTKNGWDIKVKESLNNALSLTSKENWVLGSMDDLVNDAEKEKITQELKNIYYKDYTNRWSKFLASITIANFSGIDDAIDKLDVLSDLELSPYVALFKLVRDNLELEKPSIIEQAGEAGLLETARRRISHRLGVRTSSMSEVQSSNPMTREHEAFKEFVGEEGKEDEKLPIYQYLSTLRSLYEMLVDIKENSEPGFQAAQIAGGILTTGKSTSINKGIQVTDSLLKDFRSSQKRVMRKMMIRPFDNAWGTVLKIASTHLNSSWENGVYTPFVEAIEGKYPFIRKSSNSTDYSDINEATLTDVTDFFRPGQGILWDFYNKELKLFLRFKGRQTTIKVKKWRGRGIQFSNNFVQFMNRSKIISDALFLTSKDYPKVSFSLHPLTNPNVSEMFVVVEGKNYTFINSPDEWSRFVWPLADAIHGAEMEIKVWKRGWNKEKTLRRNMNGIWGLFKLLEGARITRENPTNYKLKWTFETENRDVIPLTFQLKAGSHKNPFKKGFFRNLKAPRRIN